MTRRAIGLVVVTAIVSMLAVDCAVAQPGQGRGGRGMGRGMDGGSMGLLNDELVQAELELVDDQIDELKQIQEEAGRMMRDLFSQLQDVPREERRERMREMQEELQGELAQFQEQANEVLLPHQRDRLKQLQFQSSGRNRGAGSALQNDELLEQLGISDSQKEELDEAVAKAREEVREKYADLIREAEEDILKVLDADQRKKYRELVGEAFQFSENRGFRFNRGDRGAERRPGRNEGRNDF
ncbi:MAG: hypothetical protein ACR2NP_11390 [Pirellulaceae bacterium]